MEAARSLELSSRFPDNLPPQWRHLLSSESQADYFRKLGGFLKQEYQLKKTIFPARENILKALQSVDYPDVKVVILGQDPYHGVGQAVGMSFAVPNELRLKPPSLQNIFKEIENDYGLKLDPQHSDLSGWAKQGVLLLNAVLTVRQGQANSHRGRGWEVFTDKIIRHLNDREDPMVFLLWGSPARAKKELITNSRHKILEAPHPSPLSAHRGFLGCKHFSKANEALQKMGKTPIRWEQICES